MRISDGSSDVCSSDLLVRQVEIIPIEVVVRNVAAGSISTRLGIPEGEQLPHTLIEYYYKDDALGDPKIAEAHIACFNWAGPEGMQDRSEERRVGKDRVSTFRSRLAPYH